MTSVTKSTKRPNQAQVVEIKKLFLKYDADQDGGINIGEFNSMIKQLGIHMDKKEADAFFNSLDVDGSKKIEVGEFLDNFDEIRVVAERAHEQVKRGLAQCTSFSKEEIDMMHANFKIISKHKVDDGVIDEAEFKAMMVAGGSIPKWNTVLIDGLYRMFDLDLSGGITFEEFVKSLSTFHGKLKGGNPGDKEELLFKIYDVDRDGKVGEADLTKVMIDSLKSSNIDLDQDLVTDLVKGTLAGKAVDIAEFKQLSKMPA